MSTALAIAAVSAAIVDLLQSGLTDAQLPAEAGDVAVSARAPGAIKLDTLERPQLNLFLYAVTPNAAWRNAALPARDSGGARLSNPPLALNLHYLLTVYGKSDFQAEILLGYAMLRLHEKPLLDRAGLRAAAEPGDESADAAPALRRFAKAGLADQVEQIRITPEPLTSEELTKLWPAFQAQYRPTVAYQAAVVLIQSEQTPKQTVPVATRTVRVQPSLEPAIPQREDTP